MQIKSRHNNNKHLFWSKYSSDIVSDALAATGVENRAPLSLPILVGAGNTHTSRDDTVGLQDVDHFGILLEKKKHTVPYLIRNNTLRLICNETFNIKNLFNVALKLLVSDGKCVEELLQADCGALLSGMWRPLH